MRNRQHKTRREFSAPPASWVDKWFNIPKEKKDPLSTGLDAADKVNKGGEFLTENKGPAKVVWALNKAGLPAASQGAENTAAKIVPQLAPYASKIKFAGYAITAVTVTYETASCYNKPGD